MKKGLFLILAFLYCQAVNAALDTSVVITHENVDITTNPSTGLAQYPMWGKFPSAAKQYRKVLLALKFECGSGKDCGQEANPDNIYIGRKGGLAGTALNYEIARYVTPFGGYWKAGSGWDHNWYFDVTDFASLLHDSVEIIYQHSGYEDSLTKGWKINVSFICVEGTPVREPVAIKKLWSDTYEMGNPSKPVESKLVAVTNVMDAQTEAVRLRFINTGHGSDSAQGCMEFCSKYRKIMWDNNLISQKDIWRNDCGSNSVYPQALTWLYDRAGWCPGSPVRYDDVDVEGIAGGSTHTVDMDMQAYTANKNFGNLVSTAYLIEYKAPANTLDAELENILAPSAEKEHNRMNPICADPIIVIKNNGSTTLTGATIEYGIEGGTVATYQWTGSIPFMGSDTITLTSQVNWSNASGRFVANIKDVNGQADQFTDDNSMSSEYSSPEILPKKIIVYFKSNKDASENYYRIINASTGQVVYDRGNFANETVYNDTVNLTPGNCYYFKFSDDGKSTSSLAVNKDGLDYWAFNAIEGAGELQIRNQNGIIIKDITKADGGPYGTKGGDFGAFYNMYFTCEFGLTTPTLTKIQPRVDVYPNPANDKVAINYALNNTKGEITLTNLQGQVMQAQAINESAGTVNLNLSGYASGVYIVKVACGDETIIKRVAKK